MQQRATRQGTVGQNGGQIKVQQRPDGQAERDDRHRAVRIDLIQLIQSQPGMAENERENQQERGEQSVGRAHLGLAGAQ